ncbi:MAG: lysyl-tRNA synthetase, class [Mycobacteriales bacterium]
MTGRHAGTQLAPPPPPAGTAAGLRPEAAGPPRRPAGDRPRGAAAATRLGRVGAACRPTASRTASVVATLTWLLGVLTVASALLPGDRGRLRALTHIVPVPASAIATGGAAALGVLLLYLAGGLRRRKRRAWQVAVAVTVVVAALHLLRGLDVEEATASVGVLAVLLWSRREFYAEGDPAGRWLAVRRLAELLVLDVALGMALLQAYDRRLVGHPSAGERLRQVLLGLVGVSGPVGVRGDRSADVITATLLAFGLLTAFTTAYLLLRPAEPVALLSTADEDRLRALLAGHGGRDSLGYFALRRDKSVVWSPSGKAAVTYRVVHGVLLASGDPIGDPEAWPGAITATLELARRHGWVPAVVGCGELGATAWSRHGLDAYELGDEAVLDVPAFTLDGRPMRGVRQAVGRVRRAGCVASVRRAADIPAAELASMVTVADAWRGAGVERGFSMALSRLGDPADTGCVVVSAHQDGVLRGLLHFVPWGPDGLSLDLMRRDRTADNGLNEFLIVELLAACPALGVRRLSLNFAVFRSALERGARIGAGPVSRLWRSVLVFASRWWQIETLYRFNAKFRPAWEPRFVSFPSARDLPRIAVAALEAEAFLVRPRPLKRLLRRG